jgi:HK97 family phage prohead protease
MEHKFLDVEWKADGDGQIEGYGSVFGTLDNGGDIVAPGAFSQSLKSGRRVRMLMQHDPDKVIGVWDEMSEDANGLRVKGRFLTKITRGSEAYEMVKAGAVDGLSIGYRTIQAEKRDGARVITQADLWEVSLVTFPMNEQARVNAVKAADMTPRELERLLTQDAGLARSVARKLMAGGYDAIKAMQDAGDGADELAELLKARLTL